MSSQLTSLYKRVVLQRGQVDLVSAPFYVGGNRVAVSAFANGAGLPPGGRVKFQELVYMDGGRSDGTLCEPGKMNSSQLCDYKPLMYCGCEPTLSERNSHIELDRTGWFRAVYEGPSRASVMLVARETTVAVGAGCGSPTCCALTVNLKLTKTISSQVIPAGTAGAFTIVLENIGAEASKGGSLRHVLPAGLNYTAPSAVFEGAAVGTQPSLALLNSGSWHYTLLPVGGKITVTVPFTAGAASTVPQVSSAKVKPGAAETEADWSDNSESVFYVISLP